MDNSVSDQVIQAALRGPLEELPAAFFKVAGDVHSWHLQMLQDRPRLDFYQQLIAAKVKGKVVLDIGTGTGILSHLAMMAGASKVFSVEINPAMQSIYKALMGERLQSRKVELLDVNAMELRKEFFGDEKPQVILHEIFGSNGLSEDFLPVFQKLRAEEILTEDSVLIPDIMEIWMEPVWSDIFANDYLLEPYAGYPLDKLSIFGFQSYFQLEPRYSRLAHWQSAGEEEILFSCRAHELKIPEKLEITFRPKRCSHLRLWMKLKDEASGLFLESHHGRTDSHWANVYYPVPYWLRERSFTVQFHVDRDGIQIINFY